MVHPAGIEPTSTVPKTGTLSIELRMQYMYHTFFLAFAKFCLFDHRLSPLNLYSVGQSL